MSEILESFGAIAPSYLMVVYLARTVANAKCATGVASPEEVWAAREEIDRELFSCDLEDLVEAALKGGAAGLANRTAAAKVAEVEMKNLGMRGAITSNEARLKKLRNQVVADNVEAKPAPATTNTLQTLYQRSCRFLPETDSDDEPFTGLVFASRTMNQMGRQER